MGVYPESRSPQLFVKQLVIEYFSHSKYMSKPQLAYIGAAILEYSITFGTNVLTTTRKYFRHAPS